MSLASRKLIQATAGAAGAGDTGDDDFANVVLLLDGDGTSGDDNNTFTDSSTNGFTVTETGSVVQGSFSPYGDNWSNYFDGSSSLSVTNLTAPGTTFTVEFWVYFNDPNDDGLFQFTDTLGATSTSDRPGLFVDSAGQLKAYANGGNRGTGTTLVAGQWYHIAMVRASSTVNVYVDGTSVWNASETEDFSAHNDLNIGKLYSTGYLLNGYLSNFRYVSGTAVYTASFTPPTTYLTAITNTELLMCQSNRFIDNSSNSYTVAVQAGTPKVTPFSPFKDDDARDITTDGGSGYFDDSSNSYLQIADNSVFDATTSLCIEAWFYMTSSPGSGPDAHAIVSKWVSTTPGQRTIFIDIENTGLRVYADLQGASNPVLITTDGGAIDLYSWHHVAVTWDGSTYRAFLDGALEGSTSSSSAPIASSQVVRVGHNTNTHYFGGYITDARWVTDGGAIYTSAFTPPTSPLTAITNTELLLNFQDAGIYDRSGINNLDTVGNAQIDTAVTKYGTGSIQFDGLGDILRSENPNDLALGTGDFTVEFWLNATDVSDTQVFFDMRHNSNINHGLTVFVSSGFKFYAGTSSITIGTISDGTWHHIAIVRDGSTIRSFIDGVAGGTESNTNDLTCEEFRIGARWDDGAPMTGYIDDFRITKGIARYTSAFTPPTAAHGKF